MLEAKESRLFMLQDVDSLTSELAGLVLVDSGAAGNVCPAAHAEAYPITEGETKYRFRSATGHLAQQYGSRRVRYETEAGKVQTDYTVADVKRPIWAVSSLVRQGGSVHFTQDRSWVTTPKGPDLELVEKNGVYYAQVEVIPPTEQQETLMLTPLDGEKLDAVEAPRADRHKDSKSVDQNEVVGSKMPGDSEEAMKVTTPGTPTAPTA